MPPQAMRSRKLRPPTSTGRSAKLLVFTVRLLGRGSGSPQHRENADGGQGKMPPDRTEQLSSIVTALTGYIDVVRSFHLRETAVLLDMAKLDLQMKIHAISDRELHALC